MEVFLRKKISLIQLLKQINIPASDWTSAQCVPGLPLKLALSWQYDVEYPFLEDVPSVVKEDF